MLTDEQRQLYAELKKPFRPDQIKKVKQTGVKYIEYDDVIERLNSVVGEWHDEVVSHEVIPYGQTDNGNDRLLVRGVIRLTIPALGSREHMGVQLVTVAARGEDLMKGVISDGVKKAAEMFGVPIDPTSSVYTGHNSQEGKAPARRPAPQQGTAQPANVAAGITEEQISAITSLCQRAGILPEGVARRGYGKPLSDLTALEAQACIRDLQAGKYDAVIDESTPSATGPAVSDRQLAILGGLVADLRMSQSAVASELQQRFRVTAPEMLSFDQAVAWIEELRKQKHTRRSMRGA
jgi:hypothetical protein